MSDIAIRFDGLLLAAALAFGAAVYLVVALGAFADAVLRPGGRSMRIARRLVALAAGSAVLVGMLFAVIDTLPRWSDHDLADWLVVPWGLAFIVGAVWSFRWR